ncbi:uncharacterized protein Z520_10193 [Fonsecaea multimorphosa CBS 102226]|uniref:Uncharacterized protein n=1 Tax=Fonsecaea multimorphosa CBS 102226 TaxID=1442371 RepID=A0A0D2JLI0_9EURO|nr:uncharacterized protein Z520_10193 [Fonsecaea multimorphosa CBS 102226]KIX94167.1 hypothetical protein Z520_10193 [Fonsecaea multimorphosa CBS 102226]OAL19520.1 hypothetical protein AYO22_09682 [Fonsecaea multimorphosa]
MASSITHIEPSFMSRLSLSSLLVDLFYRIDHDAIFTAKSRDTEVMPVNLEEGGILSDTETDLSADSEAVGYPEELTMHIVLGAAMQYLQVREFGFVVSREVRGYSYEELILALKRLLRWPNCPSPAVTDTAYDYVHQAVKVVIAQLEIGNWPIEPLARDARDVDLFAIYDDADTAGRVQQRTRRSGSPAESNCSITPSESASQVPSRETRTRQWYSPANTTSWGEESHGVRYIRKRGSLSAIFNVRRRHRCSAPSPESVDR